MARSHHRKKHKEHLRQYQHKETGAAKSKKAKVSGTFAIVGVVLGAAIGYFTTDGNLTWIAFGALFGGLAGYLAGRYFDREATRP